MAQRVKPQEQQKEVICGTVRADGYNQITTGAFWSKRPEAKMIYEGLYPSGYRVFVLEQDYYVRFVDKEHNNLDRNYIIFPKGAIVYADSLGIFYSAKCGNQIEYIRPVDMVRIVVEKEFVTIKDTNSIPTASSYYITNNYYQEEKQPVPEIILKKKNGWVLPVCIVGGVTITVGIVYFFYSLARHDDVIQPRTMPPAQNNF